MRMWRLMRRPSRLAASCLRNDIRRRCSRLTNGDFEGALNGKLDCRCPMGAESQPQREFGNTSRLELQRRQHRRSSGLGYDPRTHFAKELINRAQALTGGAFGPEASILWLRSSKPVCDPGRFLHRLCASTPVGFYDPSLMKIMRWGLMLSLAGVPIRRRRSMAKKLPSLHAPVCTFGIFAFLDTGSRRRVVTKRCEVLAKRGYRKVQN
jgi:hypothetical protein